MKRAIRLGKLENGNLVGGEEGESEDEVLANDLSVVCGAVLRRRDANGGHQRGEHRRDGRGVGLEERISLECSKFGQLCLPS